MLIIILATCIVVQRCHSILSGNRQLTYLLNLELKSHVHWERNPFPYVSFSHLVLIWWNITPHYLLIISSVCVVCYVCWLWLFSSSWEYHKLKKNIYLRKHSGPMWAKSPERFTASLSLLTGGHGLPLTNIEKALCTALWYKLLRGGGVGSTTLSSIFSLSYV